MIVEISDKPEKNAAPKGVPLPTPGSISIACESGPVCDANTLTLRTFHRDLPELLVEHFGHWVAYQGDQRLGFAQTKTRLHQECLRRGLNPGEFEIFSVEPEMPNEIEVNWPAVG
jgi:hypothetical protein